MFQSKQGIGINKHIAKVREDREMQQWLNFEFVGLKPYDEWNGHPPPKIGWVISGNKKTRVWINDDGTLIYDESTTTTTTTTTTAL